MTYEEWQTKGRALLDAHGLTDWRFTVENLWNKTLYGPKCEGYLGLCDFLNKTIRLDHSAVPRQFRQTVLHEIAHALVGKEHGHDKVWMKKAGEIGCTFSHLLPYAYAFKSSQETTSKG